MLGVAAAQQDGGAGRVRMEVEDHLQAAGDEVRAVELRPHAVLDEALDLPGPALGVCVREPQAARARRTAADCCWTG